MLKQAGFLEEFKCAFNLRLQENITTRGGQGLKNTSRLNHELTLRRNGICKRAERFELGDMRFEFHGYSVIIEYECDGIAVHNLLKYWPYIKGDLSEQPSHPILLCHFSNWESWGSHRDLWNWLMLKMQNDQTGRVLFIGKQFDHGRTNKSIRSIGIQQAIDWIITRTSGIESVIKSNDNDISCRCPGF